MEMVTTLAAATTEMRYVCQRGGVGSSREEPTTVDVDEDRKLPIGVSVGFGEVEEGGDVGVSIDDDVSEAHASDGIFGFVGVAGDWGGVLEAEETARSSWT